MKNKKDFLYRITFLFFCLLLIIIRDTGLLVHPRIWAEEGSLFYAFAWQHGIGDLFLQSPTGYYLLYNNLITSLAIQFPLELFPYITTYSALLLQLAVLALILFSTSPFWDTMLKKIVICIFLILITPAAAWLNTTCAHLHLAIMSVIILFRSKPSSLAHKIFISFSALAAPVTLFLIPAFLFKFFKNKTRDNLWDLLLLSLFFFVQFFFVLFSTTAGGDYERFANFNPLLFIYGLLNDSFGMLVVDTDRALYLPVIPVLLFSVIVFILKRREYYFQLAFISFLLITFFSQALSLSMTGSPRYSYIPTFILFTIFVNMLYDHRKVIQLSSIAVVCFTLGISAYRYRTAFIYPNPDFPIWKEEVSKWKEDPAYQIKIHPKGWTMNLE